MLAALHSIRAFFVTLSAGFLRLARWAFIVARRILSAALSWAWRLTRVSALSLWRLNRRLALWFWREPMRIAEVIGFILAIVAADQHFQPKISVEDRPILDHPLTSAFRVTNAGNSPLYSVSISCTVLRVRDAPPDIRIENSTYAWSPGAAVRELTPSDGFETGCSRQAARLLPISEMFDVELTVAYQYGLWWTAFLWRDAASSHFKFNISRFDMRTVRWTKVPLEFEGVTRR
jgi:hypothetical protein